MTTVGFACHVLVIARSAPVRGHGREPLSVYDVRMARVNITMPDELHAQAKRAGLNISQVAQRAIAVELARLAKTAELDTYLAELDAELGPISDRDRAEAKAWADKVLGADKRRRSA
jgi:post-segregation antitoxin (ccd killing protein)